MAYKPTDEMQKLERHLPDNARSYLERARRSSNTRGALESYVSALDIVDPEAKGNESSKTIIDEFYERKIAGDAALSAGPWHADVEREFEKHDGAIIISKDPLSDGGCYRADPSDYQRIELMIATYLMPRMNDGTEKGITESKRLSTLLMLGSIFERRQKRDDFGF